MAACSRSPIRSDCMLNHNDYKCFVWLAKTTLNVSVAAFCAEVLNSDHLMQRHMVTIVLIKPCKWFHVGAHTIAR